MPQTHLAAVLQKAPGPMTVEERNTPEPGPNEILIEVKAVALNPVDYYQRDKGFPPIPQFPAVIGSDSAGIVRKIGSGMTGAPAVGSRVLCFATSFWNEGKPDYASFQQYTLAPAEGIVELPDSLSFEQGAIMPLAAVTAKSGWTSVGISLETKHTPQDKQAALIWGGSSSVGSVAIQSAKSMGFTVYATASPRHHEYLKKLGADAVFDYNASDVVAQIVKAVKDDGLQLNTAQVVCTGGLEPTLEILRETKGAAPAKVAHAPLLPEDHPTLENTEIKFVMPPVEPSAYKKHLTQIFREWLAPGLENGSIVPSPNVQVEGKGVEGISPALDVLAQGVSGTKIVVSI